MSNGYIRILFFTVFILMNTHSANARIIQILHTNDTHSYLDSSIHTAGLGGAAILKSLIDYYKNKMDNEGIKTLVMDAGDFTEGNLYYMANNGRKVFEIHNEMGYDVGALGNHDYLMGTRELDTILGEMDLKFSLVAANLEINSNLENLRSKILPFKEFEIDGIKIGVLGLTTNALFYKWRFLEGKITDPYKSAIYYEKILKRRQNDFIIGLTHLGLPSDIILAKKTKQIDLIIGGHSHDVLFNPLYTQNKRDVAVPIVQAGMHNMYLGRLILDLEIGQPLKILSYELIPVKYDTSDFKIESIIKEANNDLDDGYGKVWLSEKVGFSDLSAGDKDGDRKWAYYITDTIKEKTGADIGIHTPSLDGKDFPVGNVNRRDLFNSIPRVFEFTEKYGWTIYTTKIKGAWLRLVFETLAHFGEPLTFSGVTVETKKIGLGIKIKRMLVNGKAINPFKYYTVALTEGIVTGAKGISPYTFAILRNPHDTKFKIWITLQEKISQNMGHLDLDKISEENHVLIMPTNN